MPDWVLHWGLLGLVVYGVISAYVPVFNAEGVAIVLGCLTAAFGLFFLGWILWTLLSKGLANLNLDLFTMDQPPPMERGGMRNAIVGSLMMCAMGIAIGTPLGIASYAGRRSIAGSRDSTGSSRSAAARPALHSRR